MMEILVTRIAYIWGMAMVVSLGILRPCFRPLQYPTVPSHPETLMPMVSWIYLSEVERFRDVILKQ